MLKNVFGIAGTALNAQTIRLNTTASNLANAGSVSGRKKRPIVLSGRFFGRWWIRLI